VILGLNSKYFTKELNFAAEQLCVFWKIGTEFLMACIIQARIRLLKVKREASLWGTVTQINPSTKET
jgi:hypothetical protein